MWVFLSQLYTVPLSFPDKTWRYLLSDPQVFTEGLNSKIIREVYNKRKMPVQV